MKGRVEKYQTKQGEHWRIRYELPPGPDGKRRQTAKRGFRTQKEAQRALRDAIGAVEDGTHVPHDRQTLAGYLRDEWLPARKPRRSSARGHRGQVGLGTWDVYRGDLEAYVIPRLGAKRLQALTPADLDGLYDHLESAGGRKGAGLAAKTIANVHGVIHKALADAVRQGRVTRNVADAVEPPRADRARTEVWSVEQLRAFLAYVAADRLYAMWLLFATTGMRRGEVAGLTWSDLDLDAGTLRVDVTLGLVDAKATFKPRPKSQAGERTMSLDPATVEALREWRKTQLEERMAAGPGWVETNTDWRGTSRDDLVFTWPDGRMINPDRVSDWFHARREAAGLPRIRPHDLRHTYATAALANATGWHEVKVISERLGHASVGITLDTYSHVLPAADEQTAHTLARVILGG